MKNPRRMSLRVDPFARGRSISAVERDLRRFGGQFPHLYSVPAIVVDPDAATPLDDRYSGLELFRVPNDEIYESRDGVYRITASYNMSDGTYTVGVKNLRTGSYSSSVVDDHGEALDRLFRFFSDRNIDFVKANPPHLLNKQEVIDQLAAVGRVPEPDFVNALSGYHYEIVERSDGRYVIYQDGDPLYSTIDMRRGPVFRIGGR